MTYSEEQLKTIEQLAQLYMRLSEMAVIIGVSEYDLKEDVSTPDHPARNAYIRGKLSQKLEVHKQMAMLARVGSPLALQQSQQALAEMEDDEL